ncbi:T9SS type A sorting domain-containing protein [Bacteroidia bacterium]|nr:T9SS type A sorting domain-containing protein [Bacteroidia bacterium]
MKSQVPEYVPTQGLLGWWPLDGNAVDSSTNQNHGVVDGATPAKNRFGQSNKAFEFDGIDDEITFEVKQLSSLSISVWQKPIDKGEAYDPIFQLRKDCISQGYDRNKGAEMYTLKRDGEVKIVSKLGDRKCNHTSSTIGGFVPNAIASFDKWSHYVMTINGSTKEVTIYHNGKFATQGGFPFELDPTGNEVLRIGKIVQHRTGRIWSSCYTDDLGFWDRALDSNEVKTLYLSKKCDSKFLILPKDTTIANKEVEFSCQLNDSIATYSWQTNQGLGWVVLSNAGQYSGVKTNTLKIKNLSTANDNQLFRCIASSICGKDTTNEVRLNFQATNGTNSFTKKISFSPNPTSGLIRIKGLSKASVYKVYNTIGEVVLEGKTKAIIDISDLENGIYFISLNGNKKTIVKRDEALK